MHSLFSLGSFIPKIPPSDLGFVCKPELPPHINILFRARPPLKFLNLPPRKITRKYTGIFDLANNENILSKFEKNNNMNLEVKIPKKDKKIIDIIKNIAKQKENKKEMEKNWNPDNNPNATSNPYKTLFVYGLSKSVDENALKKEFEMFGEVKKVRLIKNIKGKSKGYAFVEFEKSHDFMLARDKGNRIKINGRHIYVEAERGRTDSKFKPMRIHGENGKGRELPEWLQLEISKIKKKYPQIIKTIYENEQKLEEKKDEIDKINDLEVGEIEDDKNDNNKKKEDNFLIKKRTRNKNQPSYSNNYSDCSSNSYYSYHSSKKRGKYYHKSKSKDNNSYIKKNGKKNGSEEGEID